MEDRFKFRAWDVEEERYFNDIEDCRWDEPSGELIQSFEDCLWEPDFIIEQCTGLKDRNGKLIYEGDILKSSFKNKESESDCLPVYYNKNQFSVGFNGGDAGWFSDYFVGEIEIVGNIHENPELLEG